VLRGELVCVGALVFGGLMVREFEVVRKVLVVRSLWIICQILVCCWNGGMRTSSAYGNGKIGRPTICSYWLSSARGGKAKC
jgi:hypothetical protein